jgi:hypothetical protein
MIDGPNLYTYVNQNPWTKFDPEGLATVEDYQKNIKQRLAENHKMNQRQLEIAAAGDKRGYRTDSEQKEYLHLAGLKAHNMLLNLEDSVQISHIEASAQAIALVTHQTVASIEGCLDDKTDLFKDGLTLARVERAGGLVGGYYAGKLLGVGLDALIGKITSEAAGDEAAVLQPYNEGGGHHIPAQSAFTGATNYDSGTALAIPQSELENLNLDHGAISGAQQVLYRAYAQTGQPLTWDAMQSIETQALIKGGASPGTAAATVTNAINALKASGVSGPTRIPWGR